MRDMDDHRVEWRGTLTYLAVLMTLALLLRGGADFGLSLYCKDTVSRHSHSACR